MDLIESGSQRENEAKSFQQPFDNGIVEAST